MGFVGANERQCLFFAPDAVSMTIGFAPPPLPFDWFCLRRNLFVAPPTQVSVCLCYGVTQKETIERLALDAERAILDLDRVAALPTGYADYYDGRLRLGRGYVTP